MITLYKLTNLFPLIQKKYILKDREENFWTFEERLDNGSYPRYSIEGYTIVEFMQPVDRAHLYARFHCLNKKEDIVNVFIEDVFSTRRGAGVGTWMMNKFIYFLKQVYTSGIRIERVWGDFLPEEAEEEVTERFFRKFGFRFSKRDIQYGDRVIERRVIEGSIEELRILPSTEPIEVDIEELVRRLRKI